MEKVKWLLLSVLILCLTIVTPKPGQAFYEGKVLRILVISPPGSLTDIEARLVARHIGRQIPGKPGVIVQSVVGGGGINMANYLYRVAKPDGLTIGVNGTLVALHKLLGTRGVKYKVEDFTWLGSFADPYFVLLFHAKTPYDSVAALKKASKPPKLGVPSVRHAIYLQSRIWEEALGVKFQYTFGYSPPEIELAVDRREIDGRSFTLSNLFNRRPDWIDQGYHFVSVTSRERDKRLPKTPTIWELIKDEDTRTFIETAMVPFQTPRPWSAPPGVPKDRVQILRKAFMDTLKDPKFVKDAKRSALPIYPKGGEELARILKERLTQAPPEIRKRIPKLLKPPK
ncbi:MAG: Bug family tripartite tricarboxylate transporter substrate binding protein [Candidatus Binatia bacterium]